jgi:Ca2+-binding EF-hand superfamily protein
LIVTLAPSSKINEFVEEQTMKRTLSGILALLVMSGACYAKAPQHNRQGPPPRPNFEAIDTNSDGVITFDEFSAQTPPPRPDFDAETIFNQIDADGDSQITAAEFDQFKPGQLPTFSSLDKDENGELSQTELSRFPAPFGDTQTLFYRLDIDGSNGISESEFEQFLQENAENKPPQAINNQR